MSFFFNYLKRWFSGNSREEEIRGATQQPYQPYYPQPQVIIMRPSEITETYTVPRHEIYRIWGLLSSDCPMSYMSENEIRAVRLSIEVINLLLVGSRPAVPSVILSSIINTRISELIDLYNRRILAVCRTARARSGVTLRAMAPHLGR